MRRITRCAGISKMKIGLVRHFKVDQPYPAKFLIGHQEVTEWFARYESSDVTPNQLDISHHSWDICYASTASRAFKTACYLYAGPIMPVEELKELNTLPLLNKKLRLPLLFWGILLRNKSFSENDITRPFRNKIKLLLDNILAGEEKNVLIVSHGFVMMFLQIELQERGFSGDKFKYPRNGQLYVYHNSYLS